MCIRDSNRTVFLVTNGYNPNVFEDMLKRDIYPTQLYLSVEAPNKKLFGEINRSALKDGWENLNKTLDIVKMLPCRRIMRLTLIKGLNDSSKFLKEFAGLINKGGFDFVEVKSYMWLGYSRQRLKMENMPIHNYIKEYSEKLLDFLPDYAFCDEHSLSRIVLLKRKDSVFDKKITVSNFNAPAAYYSTGDISFELEKDKTYVLGAYWNRKCRYYFFDDMSGENVNFGTQVRAVGKEGPGGLPETLDNYNNVSVRMRISSILK